MSLPRLTGGQTEDILYVIDKYVKDNVLSATMTESMVAAREFQLAYDERETKRENRWWRRLSYALRHR